MSKGKRSTAELREVLSKWDKKGGLAPLTPTQQVRKKWTLLIHLLPLLLIRFLLMARLCITMRLPRGRELAFKSTAHMVHHLDRTLCPPCEVVTNIYSK